MGEGARIGSLCSGYGGLEAGIEAVYGGSTAWVSDIDKGACKILAHRYPDAPNIGDMTAVDWSEVEPVDILCGGTPCQDLSHAGRRAGMTEGTRSNLWVAMREAIAQLRPALVIWENVRGAYSATADSAVEPCPGCVGDGSGVSLRALGRVLGDLSDLGYDASWHGLRAADVGAPHGRFRVFVAATDTQGDAGRFAHGDGGAAAYADGRLNVRGGTRADQRAVPHGDAGGASAALLPTPSCSDTNGAGAHGDGGLDLRTAVALMPTPRATDGTKGGPNQRGSSGDLMLPSAVAMLPTPQARDWKGAGPADANRHDPNLSAIGALLSTPLASSADGVQGIDRQVSLLRTPRVKNNENRQRDGFGGEDGNFYGLLHNPERWGDYAPAIARWERALGRPASEPTMTSTKGNPQLSPRFVEWLMGLPAGWVTDVPGLTRNEALKALGNGVVPQQAAEALRVMASWEVAVA